MSRADIINNCKRVTVQYLRDKIGTENLVSIILYGSVARNEESYKIVNGRVFLESDLDVLVVLKNKAVVLKWLVRLRHLSELLSNELKKECLLSYANLSITAEDRLLHAYPNAFYLHVKLNGKVIFGKELIGLMRSYSHDRYKEIPAPQLNRMIFGHMIFVVRSIASSGIFDGNITVDSYNSILKSIRKLTLFLLRAIIIKDSLPVNPYDMTDIRDKGNLYKTKNFLYDDLLSSYDDIKLCNSKADCSMVNLEKYVTRIVTQFNSTLAKLIGINYPFITLPKKLIFGHFPLIRRVEYSIYVFLINLNTRWTLELFKFLIFIVRGPESIYLQYYNLLLSSTNLIKPTNDVSKDTIQQRRSWLKRYQKSLKPWKYDKATG
jgi:predicted nucleotidyltransferase